MATLPYSLLEKMDTKLSDLHIAKIATFLPKWKHVAGQLGVGSEIIKDIEVRYPNPEDQRSEALKKWVGQDGSQATYKKLRDVLCELDEKNAAEEVEKLKVEKLAEVGLVLFTDLICLANNCTCTCGVIA